MIEDKLLYIRAILFTLRVLTFNVLLSFDVFCNTLIGGDRRETISSRLGKGQIAGKPVHTALALFVNTLFLIMTLKWNHCTDSIQNFEDTYSISTIWDKARKKYLVE